MLRDMRNRLRPAPRILSQAARHHAFPAVVDLVTCDFELLAPLSHTRRNFLPDLPIDVTGRKWGSAREQLVNAGAKRIDIVEATSALAIELLRTHVNKSAAF